jgi:pyruvate dehydrogenase E2 component (dihydrolipoamide acetyltransferase)
MGDIIAVTIPKWGLTMEEGTVVGWHAAEGDSVEAGKDLVDVESSKIANVVEAPASGVLRRITGQPGTLLPVGALIGVIADAGVADAEIDAFAADFQARFADQIKTQDKGPSGPQVAQIGGKPIAYDVYGDETAPALVFIHGFGGDRNNWLFTVGALKDRFRIVALDLPGHGASAKEVGGGSLDSLADTVAGLMDHLAISTAGVLAHSMGAGVALALAAKAPARVSSLALLCGFGLGGTLNRDYIAAFLEAERRKEMKAAAEMLFADTELVTKDLVENLLNFKRIDGVQSALETLAANALSDASAAGVQAGLGGLTVPRLAIWGASDQVVSQPASPPPGFDQVVIDAAGHMPHMEAAPLVNERLNAFFR